jgi:glycosyltransferase involved in cell wall biosynthesis
MRISVVIPAYNSQSTIEKCLESVFSQTKMPDEVVVTNDGSTDRTGEIFAKFKKKYKILKIVTHKKNMGCAAAENSAIKASTGDIIFHTDSDCFLDKHVIENGIKYFKEDPGLDVVTGLTFIGDVHIQAFNKPGKPIHDIPTTCSFIKRKVYDKIGLWDERFVWSFRGDTEMAFRAKKAGVKALCVDDVIVHHAPNKPFLNELKRLKYFQYDCMFKKIHPDYKRKYEFFNTTPHTYIVFGFFLLLMLFIYNAVANFTLTQILRLYSLLYAISYLSYIAIQLRRDNAPLKQKVGKFIKGIFTTLPYDIYREYNLIVGSIRYKVICL